jgi:hypothetical protein
LVLLASRAIRLENESVLKTNLPLTLLLAVGCSKQGALPARSPNVETAHFTVPRADGYSDVTAEFRKRSPRIELVLMADKNDAATTIVIQKAPRRSDVSQCASTGEAMVKENGWKLLRAEIVDGPAGKSCQIEIDAPEGIAIVTELQQPTGTWLMTCNHAKGDAAAEATCRSTLAGFRFRQD